MIVHIVVACAAVSAAPVVEPAPARPVFPVLGEPPEGCLARTEGSSAAGECSKDAECAAAGCSHEVCVTAERAPTLVTTCEVLPCFKDLDVCGCHAGVCSWTLKGSTP